ncbi:MAG: flagellar export chaperone FliS [Treponemataceae bacterium]
MSYSQAYTAYKETGVKTATQGKLIIMLYDEVARQISLALSFYKADAQIDVQNVEKYNNHILKAQEVITELMVSLDLESGGDIAKNLLNLYVFFNQELLDANISRKQDKLIFVRDMMADLRETWAQIIATAEATTVTPTFAGVNING